MVTIKNNALRDIRLLLPSKGAVNIQSHGHRDFMSIPSCDINSISKYVSEGLIIVTTNDPNQFMELSKYMKISMS